MEPAHPVTAAANHARVPAGAAVTTSLSPPTACHNEGATDTGPSSQAQNTVTSAIATPVSGQSTEPAAAQGVSDVALATSPAAHAAKRVDLADRLWAKKKNGVTWTGRPSAKRRHHNTTSPNAIRGTNGEPLAWRPPPRLSQGSTLLMATTLPSPSLCLDPIIRLCCISDCLPAALGRANY